MLAAVVAAPSLPLPAPPTFGIDWASGADYTAMFFANGPHVRARAVTLDEISRVFRIPPHLLTDP